MPCMWTTLGPRTADDLGLILPHEHVFVDLRITQIANGVLGVHAILPPHAIQLHGVLLDR